MRRLWVLALLLVLLCPASRAFLPVPRLLRGVAGSRNYNIPLQAQKKKKGNQRISGDDDDDDEVAEEKEVMMSAAASLTFESEDDEEAGGDEDEDVDEEVDVVDSIDDIDAETEEVGEEASGGKDDGKWKTEVTTIITKTVAAASNLALHKIAWLGNRIEVIVVEKQEASPDDLVGPGVDVLKDVHRDLYNRLEARDSDLNVVARYEICVASPGIGQFLRSDRDFVTFRGFPIAVQMKEEYKKKVSFEGTLVERDEVHVLLSLKGRIVKLPRNLIDIVSLPKSKFESTDSEMRKLR